MNKILIPLFAAVILSSVIGINSVNAEENKIPTWVKGIFAYYVEDEIQDTELINALAFLIDEGILEISEKKYDSFSLEKFPDTGGFNPAWLSGEREKIIENCNEARSMGYENSYCKYVQ